MRWDDGWDAEPSRASKLNHLETSWKLMMAPSKSFEKTRETRGLARET
jgi:hypothetical protein